MLLWKDQVTDANAFSLIGATTTVDFSASDEHTRDVWVKGLTKLLGQSEEDRAAAQEAYDPNAAEVTDLEQKREKTGSQMQTQRNLFSMQVKTIIREINFEGLYGVINDMVKEEFNSDVFYQKAIGSQTDWRGWDQWIRKQIVDY